MTITNFDTTHIVIKYPSNYDNDSVSGDLIIHTPTTKLDMINNTYPQFKFPLLSKYNSCYLSSLNKLNSLNRPVFINKHFNGTNLQNLHEIASQVDKIQYFISNLISQIEYIFNEVLPKFHIYMNPTFIPKYIENLFIDNVIYNPEHSYSGPSEMSLPTLVDSCRIKDWHLDKLTRRIDYLYHRADVDLGRDSSVPMNLRNYVLGLLWQLKSSVFYLEKAVGSGEKICEGHSLMEIPMGSKFL